MKIGIIGFGAIGFDVAKKLDQEKDQWLDQKAHEQAKLSYAHNWMLIFLAMMSTELT